VQDEFTNVDDVEAQWYRNQQWDIERRFKASTNDSNRDFDSQERNLNKELRRLEDEISRISDQQEAKSLKVAKQSLAVQLASLAQLREIRLNQIKEQKVAEERHLQQLSRDFSIWRQTPEGHYFHRWCSVAGPLAKTISQIESSWSSKYVSLALGNVDPGEIGRAKSRIWIERGKLSSHFYVALSATIASIFALLIAIGITDGGQPIALWLLPFGLVIWTVLVAWNDKNSKEWRDANRAQGARESLVRRDRFGFDPLSNDVPPSVFNSPIANYPQHLHKAALDAIEYHTHPDDLPQLFVPSFVETDEVKFEPMKFELEDLRQRGEVVFQEVRKLANGLL